jgi:hypothetical protein
MMQVGSGFGAKIVNCGRIDAYRAVPRRETTLDMPRHQRLVGSIGSGFPRTSLA